MYCKGFGGGEGLRTFSILGYQYKRSKFIEKMSLAPYSENIASPRAAYLSQGLTPKTVQLIPWQEQHMLYTRPHTGSSPLQPSTLQLLLCPQIFPIFSYVIRQNKNHLQLGLYIVLYIEEHRVRQF